LDGPERQPINPSVTLTLHFSALFGKSVRILYTVLDANYRK
jgi:hypothetical protein